MQNLTALLSGISENAVRTASAVALAVAPLPADAMTEGLRMCGQRADQGTLYGGQVVDGFRAQDHFRTEGDGEAARDFIEVAASFGEPVVRYDYANRRVYVEVLDLSDGAVDLSRMQGNAPWLVNHWAYDLERDQKGRIVNAEMRSDDQGRRFIWIRVQLSATPDNANYRQNVRDGIFFGASIGYRYGLDDVEMTQGDDGVWVYVIKRWQPYETSNVSIPAGALSALRSAALPTRHQENPMPDAPNAVDTNAQGEQALRTAVDTATQNATTAERSRIAEINEFGSRFEIPAEVTVRAIQDGTSFSDFARTARRAEVEDLRNNPADPQRRVAPQARQENTNAEQEMQAREDAWVARALRRRPGAEDTGDGVGAISADARQFMDQTPSDIALAVGNIRGDRTIERYRRAQDITLHAISNYSRSGHSTSDFPAFLGGALTRVVIGGFNRMRERLTYGDFTFNMTAPNMNSFDVMYKGAFYGVEGIPEWGALPEMSMAEHSSTLRAEKRGGRFGVSLEVIINDNFGMLDDAAVDMGMAGARDEQRIAEIALKNGLRRDAGTGLRKSIYDKTVGTKLDPAVLDNEGRLLDAMKLAISRQTEPGVPAGKAEKLGLQGTTLLYSDDLEAQVERLNALIVASRTGDVNIHRNRYKLVKLLHADPGTLYMMDDADLAKIVAMVRVSGWEGIQVRPILVPDGLSAEWGMLNIVGTGVARERGIVQVTGVTAPPPIADGQ